MKSDQERRSEYWRIRTPLPPPASVQNQEERLTASGMVIGACLAGLKRMNVTLG